VGAYRFGCSVKLVMEIPRSFYFHAWGVALLCSATALSQPSPQTGECFNRNVLPRAILDSRVIVLGEVHGTNEAPGFAGRLVCSLAAIGDEVVLALEIPEFSTPNIADYMSSDNEAQRTTRRVDGKRPCKKDAGGAVQPSISTNDEPFDRL
jgi:hypothetical protein